MGKKSKNRKKGYVKTNKKSGVDSIAGIKVEKVAVQILCNDLNDVEKCSCYRKGFCLRRDDKCKPNSLKCIKNKSGSGMATFTSVSARKSETTRKVYRSSYNYSPEVKERYGGNKKLEYLTNVRLPIKLYVFKGFLNLSKENTTDYYLVVQNIGNNKQCKILVAYNSITKRYYISNTQLKWLHKNKIFPDVIFCACNDGSEPLLVTEFKEFSELALYGYSAGKNGLNDEARRKILRHIIDNKILKRYEVVEHLQGLISLREGREDVDFSAAIKNWTDDIIYVNQYKN